jgi:folate-binding protein YgfZ
MFREKPAVQRVDRSWIRASGKDAQRFLNGMWTGDLKFAAAQSASGPVALSSFLLTNKGRAIAEGHFCVVSADEIWISISSAQVDKALVALQRYLVADDVELSQDTETFTDAYLVAAPDLSSALIDGKPALAKDVAFRTQIESWGWCLPRRVNKNYFYELWIKKGQTAPVAESRAAWLDWRIGAGVPEWGVDLGEDSLPLEFPVSEEISFFKGCYIGQETIARATFRGHVTQVLARFESAGPLSPGEFFVAGDETHPVGVITSVSGRTALGKIRVSALAQVEQLRWRSNSDLPLFTQITPLIDEHSFKG